MDRKLLMKALASAGNNPRAKELTEMRLRDSPWLSQAQDAAAQPAPGTSKAQRLATA
jgi:hypothetical protein